ncbi:hypothetical protein Agub_g1295, partial [Astrephomene gubernaculifera]
VGALGRLIVGSRFSAEFDEDPRRWRLAAEVLTSAGLALEASTCLAPHLFLQLACAGKFCQALGKGMGKPVFRVIQTHFARAANVGAVAAKEEVWEVVAQMAGLAASVALLGGVQRAGGSDASVLSLWAAIQTLHVALRYRALTTLTFPSLSLKRAALLASEWVRGRPLPDVAAGNAREPVMTDPWDVRPRVRMGCSVAEAYGSGFGAGSSRGDEGGETSGSLSGSLKQWTGGLVVAGSGVTGNRDEGRHKEGTKHVPGAAAASSQAVALLLSYIELYDKEGYVLVWRAGTAHVVLKEGHTGRDLLRAVWQAAWLDCWRGSGSGSSGD